MAMTKDEFEAVLRVTPMGEKRRRRFVVDLALTEMVRYNCVDIGPDVHTWVLTGGLAIRHCYGGTRLSADVDLTTDPSVEVVSAGASEPRKPPGFEVDEAAGGSDGPEADGPSRKYSYHFSRPYGSGHIRVDLNVNRPIDDPPAQKRPFTSIFIPRMLQSFEVQVASLEDILVDKLAGLLRFRSPGQVPRARDLYDLNFIFERHGDLDVDKLRSLILKDRHLVHVVDLTTRHLRTEVPRLLQEDACLQRYRAQWDFLGDLIDHDDLPDFDAELARLIARLADLGL